jgi:hypothetical protein
MGDLSCVEACRDLGAWGQLLALLLVGSRLAWAEIQRRRLKTETQSLAAEKQGLERKVEALSIAPKPISMPSLGDLTLHLRGMPLESLTPPPPDLDGDKKSDPTPS